MSADSSSGAPSSGSVISHDEKTISCRIDSSGSVAEQKISTDDVVGLLPPSSSSEEHLLLYVEEKEEEPPQEKGKEDNEGNEEDNQSPPESRRYFRQLHLSNPPKTLVERYAAQDTTWLQQDEKHKLTILVSTNSGVRAAEKTYENLLSPLINAITTHIHGTTPTKHTPEVIYTNSATSMSQYAKTTMHERATQGLAQTLILLSGDGGMVEIINGLLATAAPADKTYRKPIIALMPLGTGNALARSSGLMRDNTLGLAALLRGTARALPLLRISMPADTVMLDSRGNAAEGDVVEKVESRVVHGAVVFSWCFHASLVADADREEYRKHGTKRYWMAGMENLFPQDGSGAHIYDGRIELLPASDGAGGGSSWKMLERKGFSYFLVTLVSVLEKGFVISPASKPLDGVMRVVYLNEVEGGGEGIGRIMQLVGEGGKHVEDKEVGYEAVDGVRVWIDESKDRWRRVCVDGTIYVAGRGGNREDSGGYIEVVKEQKEVVDLRVL